ncbi:MAG: pyrroline-5-carboxylate reductase [Nitrospinae bacterium]|nr:pyrroline-5-carboxylate reductase [Nitrospinota bacterium]
MLGKKKIAVIGAGFMGAALIRGLLRSEAVAPGNLMAADPRQGTLAALREEFPDPPKVTADNREAAAFADIILLAVKPGMVADVLAPLKRTIGKKLVVSIAAGVPLATLEEPLVSGARLVRAMPNMGAAVGASATALAAGRHATEEDLRLARSLFDAVGECVVVDESLMDAVTGLSGSGPAFVFLFLEALVDAGVQMGLARDTARTLAGQTLYGAARLAALTGEHPGKLIDQITSPGGTTIAGLAHLEQSAFKGGVMGAVRAATLRSRELGQK